MPTFEAIYEDGEIEWVDDEPEPGCHHVQVTVLSREPKSRDPEEVRRILDKAQGVLGTDKTIEEVDEEIEEMRGG